MAGPHSVITVHGNMDRSLCTEEHTTSLAAEVQVGLIKPNSTSTVKPSDPVKRVWTTPQNDTPARQELNYQSGLCLIPNQIAAYVPRAHNYALKIPWATMEAYLG